LGTEGRGLPINPVSLLIAFVVSLTIEQISMVLLWGELIRKSYTSKKYGRFSWHLRKFLRLTYLDLMLILS